MGHESKTRSAYKGTSSKAILHQYDFLGDFYRLILGPELVFSYGMWEEGDTLDSAQIRKLDYHAEAAHAVGADRVLDIGCGYGSLLHRLGASPPRQARGRDHHEPRPGRVGP